MRLLLLFALAGCGGFDLNVYATVDPAIGTVEYDGHQVSTVQLEQSFDSIDVAKDKAIDVTVSDAMGSTTFDVRPYLANCAGRAIGTVEREDLSLFIASGSDGLSLVFEGASCFGTEGSYTAAARR